MKERLPSVLLAAGFFSVLVVLALSAPEFLSEGQVGVTDYGPGAIPPFGGDSRGRPLWQYAAQGAQVVAIPAVLAGVLVGCFAALGGLVRAMELRGADTLIQAFSEVVGALPRMVVVLVVALLLPREWRGLTPLAVVWALLAAPGAMDEAAAVAERLGGARFVEALRAHGYSMVRIFGVHVVAFNLRPVIVRQAAEVTMQVVFLEIALSYLATADQEPSFTHADNLMSWADILYLGYTAVAFQEPFTHAMVLGIALVALVAGSVLSISHAARAR